MEQLRFDGKVALVTGAAGSLGAAYARLLAERGASVVVNDMGSSLSGSGHDVGPAQRLAAEINAAGFRAAANTDPVQQGERLVECALDRFGRLDIVVNNAGNLRDRAFHNMTSEDWEEVYRVHLYGAFAVTRSAWPHLRAQQYGRVVLTSSVAGLFGNFGQANYAAVKLATVGLCRTLAIEGRSRGINVNAISPSASSRMSETMMPKERTQALRPEYVSSFVAYLCHESCDATGRIFAVGGGWAGEIRIAQAEGARLGGAHAASVEEIAKNWQAITAFDRASYPSTIAEALAPVVADSPDLAAQLSRQS
jgi:3-hydroxyacyl-CoA dehydrogenase/3a,7a,12a-trihydroxy-5b-cholest-24-enoyl-CoA hydratase